MVIVFTGTESYLCCVIPGAAGMIVFTVADSLFNNN